MAAADQSIKGILLDLDGVLWRGDEPVPGAAESVHAMKEAGYSVRFVSNNSILGRSGIVKTLEKAEVPASADEVFLATTVLAQEIAKRTNRATVYLIGSEKFKEDLEDRGLRVIEKPEEIDYLTDFVVVGGDRKLTYEKLTRALRCLLQGARFAAPNVDPTYPSHDGLVPGNGALVGAIEGMTGRKPDLMVGKPEPHILNAAMKSMGLSPEECIMVGDSIQSDHYAAEAAGVRSVLVLTGNVDRSDIEAQQVEPWAVLESVADLPDILKQLPSR